MDRFLQSMLEKKKEWMTGAAAFAGGAALLLGYLYSGPDAKAYANAETAVSKWQASPEDEKLYEAMRLAIQSVPELGKKYEATIAQNLIGSNKINEALVMACRSIQRVKEDAPFHATFATTSLLIEQGSFQQALENAVALKELMGKEFQSKVKGGSLLYAYNLLRIACLQQTLKNRPGEKAAWEELESFLTLSDEIIDSFSDKKVDLRKYIAERKKWL
jgi:hypothetical protein